MSEHAGKVFRVRYHTNELLYQAYMMFCKDGGIFVPTANPPAMQANVFLMVELPGSAQIYAVSGRVAWINFGRRKGVGVKLNPDEDGRVLQTAIQNLLGGMLNAISPTLTM
jgi:type IV pilus assembly protein PilZ